MDIDDIVQELLLRIHIEQLTDPALQVHNARLRAMDLTRNLSRKKRIDISETDIEALYAN